MWIIHRLVITAELVIYRTMKRDVLYQRIRTYALEQGYESFGRHDNTVNMLFEMDEVRDSQAFQVSNGKKVSAKNFMYVNFEQLDACNVDMQPNSTMIPGSR